MTKPLSSPGPAAPAPDPMGAADPAAEIETADGDAAPPNAARERYHHGDLRAALIDAAAAQIALEGVENFSLKATAREAGVSKGAPYRHFKDKADLVGHVAANGFEQLSEACRDARSGHPRGSVESLIAMGHAYLDYVTGRPELYHLMWGAARERFEHEEAQCCAERGYGVFIETIQDLQRAQGLEHIDTYALATPLWAMVHGIASLLLGNNQNVNGDPEAVRRLVENATRVYLAGLKATAPPAPR